MADSRGGAGDGAQHGIVVRNTFIDVRPTDEGPESDESPCLSPHRRNLSAPPSPTRQRGPWGRQQEGVQQEEADEQGEEWRSIPYTGPAGSGDGAQEPSVFGLSSPKRVELSGAGSKFWPQPPRLSQLEVNDQGPPGLQLGPTTKSSVGSRRKGRSRDTMAGTQARSEVLPQPAELLSPAVSHDQDDSAQRRNLGLDLGIAPQGGIGHSFDLDPRGPALGVSGLSSAPGDARPELRGAYGTWTGDARGPRGDATRAELAPRAPSLRSGGQLHDPAVATMFHGIEGNAFASGMGFNQELWQGIGDPGFLQEHLAANAASRGFADLSRMDSAIGEAPAYIPGSCADRCATANSGSPALPQPQVKKRLAKNRNLGACGAADSLVVAPEVASTGHGAGHGAAGVGAVGPLAATQGGYDAYEAFFQDTGVDDGPGLRRAGKGKGSQDRGNARDTGKGRPFILKNAVTAAAIAAAEEQVQGKGEVPGRVPLSGGGPKRTDYQRKYGVPTDEYGHVQQTITTMMLKNIPCRKTQEEVMMHIDRKHFSNRYDFFYLPRDVKFRANLGYAFINFVTPEDAARFQAEMNGYRFAGSGSNKACQVVPAHVQGLMNNLAAFKRTEVMRSSRKPYFSGVVTL